MSKWNTTKLVAIASLVVLAFIGSLAGGFLVALTGIPGAGGFISPFFVMIVVIFALLVIRKFWTATIGTVIYSFLVLPTPIFGPPGFLPKILIIVALGIWIDMVYFLFKKNDRLASVMTGILSALVVPLLLMSIGLLFNMPGIDKFIKVLLSPFPIIFSAAIGAVGGYIGYLLYNKLKNTAIVRRIQA